MWSPWPAPYPQTVDAILAPMRGRPRSASAIGIGTARRRPRWRSALAACRSRPSAAAARAPPPSQTTTTDDASTTAATTTTLDAPPATSGPLTPGAPIALPFAADRVTAAESPDGAVFAAPQDPTSPPPRSPGWSTATVPPPSPSTSHRHRRPRRRRQQLLRRHLQHRLRLRPRQRQPGRAVEHADGHAANSSDDDLVALATAAATSTSR